MTALIGAGMFGLVAHPIACLEPYRRGRHEAPFIGGGKRPAGARASGRPIAHCRACSIRFSAHGGELQTVVEMANAKMPREHAPMPERLRSNDPILRDAPHKAGQGG